MFRCFFLLLHRKLKRNRLRRLLGMRNISFIIIIDFSRVACSARRAPPGSQISQFFSIHCLKWGCF
jgi:hypothetical protein